MLIILLDIIWKRLKDQLTTLQTSVEVMVQQMTSKKIMNYTFIKS